MKKNKALPTSPLGVFYDLVRRLNFGVSGWVGPENTESLLGVLLFFAVLCLILTSIFLESITLEILRSLLFYVGTVATITSGVFVFVLARSTIIEFFKARSFIIRFKGLSGASSKIKAAPGTKLLSVVEFFYSPQTVELTFKPLVADWQKEYFDALQQSRVWKARWINVRYRIRFFSSIGLTQVCSLFKIIMSAVR